MDSVDFFIFSEPERGRWEREVGEKRKEGG
jgi:hypothetical protein